jgi:hypothetical protein
MCLFFAITITAENCKIKNQVLKLIFKNLIDHSATNCRNGKGKGTTVSIKWNSAGPHYHHLFLIPTYVLSIKCPNTRSKWGNPKMGSPNYAQQLCL